MAAVVEPAAVGRRIPIPAWTWAVLTASLAVAYVMLQENGLLLNSWTTVHEFFHDGRHALGFPCH